MSSDSLNEEKSSLPEADKNEIFSNVEGVQSSSDTQPQTSNGSFGSWFSSIVQTAKDTVNKSADTIESIKRDLNEFKDAIQNDTTNMVYSTASVMKKTFSEIGNTVNEIGSLGTSTEENILPKDEIQEKEEDEDEKKEEKPTIEINNEQKASFNFDALNSITNLITDKAKTTFTVVKDTLIDSIFINRDFLIEELDDELYVNKNGEIIPLENWKNMLHKLQIDPNTYCREPSGPPEDFELWLTKFNLLNYHKQNEHLLNTVPEIRKYHTDLIPDEMSDSDFWHRYYYKLYQLKEEQKRMILDVSTPSSSVSPVENKTKELVNVKYLNEKLSDSEKSKTSGSSIDEWEKMDNSAASEAGDRRKSKDTDRSSSDEDRDWVKCD